MPAKLGDLEPLYRWLRLRNETDPVEALLQDIETLSKAQYIKNLREGVHTVIQNPAIDAEVLQEMQSYLRGDDGVFYFQTSYQAVGEKMYIAISRVGPTVAKTALALCINENDTVEVHFIEPDPLFTFASGHPTLYGSISTVIVAEDGQIKHGFIRCETSMMMESGTEALLVKCDFRLSRTQPFYIAIDAMFGDRPVAQIGVGCQVRWEAQCSR